MITRVRKILKIGLAFVSDQKMQELNKKHRHVDEATDVLAFPYNDELPDGTLFLGEIVINGDQAKSKGEILELIRHGAENLLKSVKESRYQGVKEARMHRHFDTLTH